MFKLWLPGVPWPTVHYFKLTEFPSCFFAVRKKQPAYWTLETVFEIRGGGGDWDMHAVLARHQWLLERLAAR